MIASVGLNRNKNKIVMKPSARAWQRHEAAANYMQLCDLRVQQSRLARSDRSRMSMVIVGAVTAYVRCRAKSAYRTYRNSGALHS
jgi:hypothetical protein